MTIKNILEITVSLFLAFEWITCDDFPTNVVVMAGSDKVLPCSGGLPFRWYVYPPSKATEDKVIFMGDRMADNSDPQFRVYSKPNDFPYRRLDLLITDISHDHFGTYKCQKSGSSHCAELIVLGSDPKCSKYQKTADKVQLKCDVDVTINGVPEMKCFHNLNRAHIHTHCQRKRANETAVCKAKVPASAKDDYTCVIGIKHQPILTYLSCVKAADNPNYQFIWNTSDSPISRYSSENSIVKLSSAIVVGLAVAFIIIISAMSFTVCCVKQRRQSKLFHLESDLLCTKDAEWQHKNCNLLPESHPESLPMSQEHQQLSLGSNSIKIYRQIFHKVYAFLFCKTRSSGQRIQLYLPKMASINIELPSSELLHK